MTSVAMTAGVLPTELDIGLDIAFRDPMAIAAIGTPIEKSAVQRTAGLNLLQP